ncbi:hypothetical protein AX774_g1983 [Zancudomyces culisetae]|uniref:Uncharacterized protein n=1 Tax=Zancudomyces culisetae TaxID=1213189 RepID=A0A1R1PU76_ZANCU|nr:hypothetical protein AX774_g1983 [Zancudomyces culisetae]|eukprot:OMH84494.1 hypothetical protein AX774_g1983 [Zancudomyces culisetae]
MSILLHSLFAYPYFRDFFSKKSKKQKDSSGKSATNKISEEFYKIIKRKEGETEKQKTQDNDDEKDDELWSLEELQEAPNKKRRELIDLIKHLAVDEKDPERDDIYQYNI